MSENNDNDEPAIVIEDGEVVGGSQSSDRARERGSQRSGTGGGRTADDFDPDDYPEARTVSELGEIRREDYGLTEQEQRRVDRGEDPVPDGGQGFVALDPSFDDPDQEEGEVIGRGDTREEATADAQLRTGRLDTGFTERTDQREVFREQERQLRGRRDRIQETIDELPEADRLNLRGTDLESELGGTAEREEVVDFFEDQRQELDRGIDGVGRTDEQFEPRSRRQDFHTDSSQFLTPTVSPDIEDEDFEVDPFGFSPIGVGDEMVLLGPDDEDPDRGMRVGMVHPSGTDIQGTSLMEQQEQMMIEGGETPILPDATHTGFSVQQRIEDLGDVRLGDIGPEPRIDTDSDLEDWTLPDGVIEPAGRAGRDVTELGLGSLQFGGALLRDPVGTASEFADSLEPTIQQAPFAGAAEADIEEDGELSPATVRMATPGDLGPTPQEQRTRIAGGGLATAAIPVPGGLPRTGGSGRTARGSAAENVPVRQRTELDPDDIPDAEQVPREVLDDSGNLETGLPDPVFETFEAAPGLEARGRVFDEDVRGQRRGIETSDRGGLDELRPEERELLRQRLEERRAAPGDEGVMRQVIDDLEEIFFDDSDLMGQAQLSPQRQRSPDQDIDDFADFIEPGTGRAAENLADVGQIPQPRRPVRGRAQRFAEPSRIPGLERVGLSFGLMPVQDEALAQEQDLGMAIDQEQEQEFGFEPFLDTDFAFTSRGTTAAGRPESRFGPDPELIPRGTGLPRGMGRPLDDPEPETGFLGVEQPVLDDGDDVEAEFAPDFGTAIGLFEEGGEEVGTEDDPATGLERRGRNDFESSGLF